MSQKTDKNANSIFEKIIPVLKKLPELIIILGILDAFHRTRSVAVLLIGIPVVLICIKYQYLFFEVSVEEPATDIVQMPKITNSKFEKIISILKKIWVVMILLSILGVAYVFPQLGRTPPRDRSRLDINYCNAPEGTAYVDILGKIDSSDEDYTDFNAVPQDLIIRSADYALADGEPLDIDENSEIAKYNENGYMSLSIHSTDVTFFDLNNNSPAQLVLGCRVPELYKEYGKFRLAYVGEHGEVLGVTKKTSHTYDFHANYAVIANGDKATYSDWNFSPLTYAAFYIIQLTFYVTLIIIPVNIINKILWKQWVNKAAHRLSDRNNDN